MTPTRQTRIGPNGNCFAACLASILDLPLHSIPEFVVVGESDDDFYNRVQEFLKSRGLFYVQVSVSSPIASTLFNSGGAIFHTIEGVSPRGGQHATVGLNGKLVWDPHPPADDSRRGVKPETYGFIGKRL